MRSDFRRHSGISYRESPFELNRRSLPGVGRTIIFGLTASPETTDICISQQVRVRRLRAANGSCLRRYHRTRAEGHTC